MSGHRVEWRHQDDTIIGQLCCDEPPGAPCHRYCAHGCCGQAHYSHYGEDLNGCGEDHADGDWVPTDYCNPVTWIENSADAAEHYAGPNDAPVHDGPVVLEWDTTDYESWMWRYADTEGVS